MPQTRRYRIYDSGPLAVASLLVCMALAAACGPSPESSATKGTYDPKTGQLIQITHDRNQNGRIDTWTRMEGARPISSQLDTNEDGAIDRWEEYDAQGQLARAGWIRQPGTDPLKPVADTWVYPSADGKTSRIEYLDADNSGNHVVTRREFYEGERLTRVEEDKDGDAVPDQWETWEGGALKYAEFDEGNDGKPDRRFTYDKGALVLIESAPDATGVYTRRVAPGGR